MKYSNILGKYSVLVALFIIVLGSCVPLRKQIAFSDKEKHSLRLKQMMDTTIATLPYEYKIRKGDVLGVNIISVVSSSYSLTNVINNSGSVETGAGYLVNDSGYIDLPIMGLVKVEGERISEVSTKLKTLASDYLNNVTVTVRLLNFQISVFGEKTGRVTSPDGKVTIIDAISQIGGLTEFTNLRRVKIIRREDGGDKIHIFYVDVSDVGIIATKNYYLMPDDVLVLEPLKGKNVRSYQLVTSIFISTVSLIFFVYSLGDRITKL
jgi:polysaccharide export outer membrane protein